MAAGYFDDGTVHIELGAHVFALGETKRRVLTLKPHGAAASVLPSGGGIIDLTVSAQRLRANLGDAERYIYEHLHALATSDAGEVGFEDNRGQRHVYGDAVCVGGQGEVRGWRFADMTLDFECPEKSSEPAWGGVPAAVGTYAGTGNLQDYRAGGVSLGDAGSMRIEMQRDWTLRELPRARGARTSAPWRGAVMRFIVTVLRIAGAAEALATDVEDLVRSIGPGEVDLVANGNLYEGVVLVGARPRQTDAKYTELELEFEQDVRSRSVRRYTTTTTAAPITTTTTTP